MAELQLRPAEKATVMNVYKSTIANCNFVFSDGVMAHFLNHEYLTNDPVRIDLMNAEVQVAGAGNSAHPHIYVDANEVTKDTIRIDVLAEVRAKAIEDYKASLRVAMDPTKDGGSTSFSGRLEGIANTNTIAEGAASSDSNAAPGSTTNSSESTPSISSEALASLRTKVNVK